jgi:hypothetical protein
MHVLGGSAIILQASQTIVEIATAPETIPVQGEITNGSSLFNVISPPFRAKYAA